MSTAPGGRPRWRHKDLLDVASLEVDEIGLVLGTAEPFREVAGRAVKKVPTLRGKTVFLLDYGRGATSGAAKTSAALAAASFDVAARRLSADSVVVDVANTDPASTAAVADTLAQLDAMAADLVVLRHPEAGLAGRLAGDLSAGLVNAGDGAHENPVAGLACAFTLHRLWKERGDAASESPDTASDSTAPLSGARYALVGDLLTSAAARSTLLALTALGAEVVAAGLHTRVPVGLDAMGAEVADSVDDALSGAHGVVVFPPPPSTARSGEGRDYPSNREYHHLAGLTAARLERAAPGCAVLHHGPPGRGLSIAADVADAARGTLRAQAGDALAVRMAVLYLLAGRREDAQRKETS